jgi:serine/threonine protein kinase
VSQPAADRNLLFGILALQMDFISRDALIAAMNAWVLDKTKTLGHVLGEQGRLSAERLALLDALVAEHLKAHAGDPQQSLAAVSSIRSVRRDLQALGDAEVEGSLAHVSADRAVDPEETSADTSAAWLTTGMRFQVLRPHARGGLGEVFVARDTEVEREVALKEIQARHADHPHNRARFLLEAKVTGALEHPGVVPVYGLGTYADGRPYYAMRFVKGDSLKDAIAAFHQAEKKGQSESARSLGLRQLLGRFVDVCQAIAYAHSRGVLHRDLKPGNIMLGKYGETLVVDWGLAKVLGQGEAESTEGVVLSSGEAGLTQAGKALGTPAYMSPEQAAGQLDELGPRSDVYSLGATLYCLLTGQPPFLETEVGVVLARVQKGDYPRPRKLNPRVPPALEAVCLRAMAPRPEDRYATPHDLAEEIERWLADEPVSAYRETLFTRGRRWARHHKPLVAGVAAATLALVVVGTVLGVHHVQQQEAAQRETQRWQTEVEQQQAVGLAAAQAGDVERGIAVLSEAAGLCRRSAVLAENGEEIAGQLRQLEQYRRFRALADSALRTGVHNIHDRRKENVILKQAEEALAIYKVPTRPDWLEALAGLPLSAGQTADIRRLAHELLILTALRLALFDTRDEAAKVNTRRALDLLDRAAALEAPTAGIWMLRMFWNRRLSNNKRADDAGARLTEAVKKGGLTSARDNYLLGSFTLHALKKPKDAVLAYQKALAREPNNFAANFGLFLCYDRLNDTQAKLAPLTICLAIRPDDPELYYFRGMTHFALKDYQSAFTDFDTSVARDPNYKTGYFYRGRMHAIGGRWAGAEKDFSKALAIDHEFIHARSWRAVARAKLNRHRDAVADAEQAVRREPASGTTLFFAARAYAQAVRAVGEVEKPPEQQGLAQKYGDRAMELLKQAFAHGFKERQRLARGSDFDTLHARQDFQQLLTAGAQPADRQ